MFAAIYRMSLCRNGLLCLHVKNKSPEARKQNWLSIYHNRLIDTCLLYSESSSVMLRLLLQASAGELMFLPETELFSFFAMEMEYIFALYSHHV